MREYLSPGRFIDSDHPAVVEFAEQHRGASRDPLAQAISLYYAVREAVRYNPYTFSLDAQTLCGSHALATGESYCVPKATLLAGCAAPVVRAQTEESSPGEGRLPADASLPLTTFSVS